jgi:hypothetical protein
VQKRRVSLSVHNPSLSRGRVGYSSRTGLFRKRSILLMKFSPVKRGAPMAYIFICYSPSD